MSLSKAMSLLCLSLLNGEVLPSFQELCLRRESYASLFKSYVSLSMFVVKKFVSRYATRVTHIGAALTQHNLVPQSTLMSICPKMPL